MPQAFEVARAVPRRRHGGWDPLLVLLSVNLFASVGRVHQLFPVIGLLHPAAVSYAAAVLYFLLDRDPGRRAWPVLRTPAMKLLVAFLVWMALATPGALVLGIAVSRLAAFAQTLSVVLMMAAATRGLDDVERLAAAFYASIVLYGAVILTRFDARFSNLYDYDGNDFATIAVMAVPLGVYFATVPGHWLRRVAAAASLAPLGVAFVRCESRGGFLALIAAVAFLLVRATAIPARWRVTSAAAMALLIATSASGQFWERMKSVTDPQDDYNMTGDFGRIAVWKRGLGYVTRFPVLGVGPDNFEAAEGRYAQIVRHYTEIDKPTKWSAPHDVYVEVSAELGIPGLLLFLGVIGTGIAAARRMPGLDPLHASLGQAIAAGFVAFAIGGMFLSLAYADAPYVLYALGLGMARWAPMAMDARHLAAVPQAEGYAWSH